MKQPQAKDDSSRARRGREIYKSIGKVLFHHWDPIGVRDAVKGEDEYDAYIGAVYRLLALGATDREIEAFLIHTERETMGLATSTVANHLVEVMKQLRSVDISLG